MIGALLYLQALSTWNRLVTRLRRLKKPKYLLGALAGALYCYFYFFRFLFSGRRGTGLPGLPIEPETLEFLGAVVLAVIVLGGWLFPSDRAALTFTEAEVAFLFPAPVSRRMLIHFKLLKSQFGILFATVIFALLTNRFSQGTGGWAHLAGWWLILSLLNFHFLGASFVRTQLLERGLTNAWRRGIIVGLVIVVLGAVALWARQSLPPPAEKDLASLPALARYGSELLQSGPLPWILYPFRLVLRPFLAPDALTFLQALWPVLGLLALHYLWVIRANVAFEEASLALAQRRAEHLASIRQGQLGPWKRKRRRDPFLLKASGPPAVAFLWKNLLAAGSAFTLRMAVTVTLLAAGPAFLFSLLSQPARSPGGLGPALGMFLLMGLFFTLLIGPQVVRYDFRSDLRVVDMLKLYPLPGWRVVLGELLAPTVILTVIQWILVLLAAVLLSRLPGGPGLPVPTRIAAALAAAMILPMLNLVSLLIPNAAVLLFPAFFQSGQDMTQGIEATGQRLIFLFGQLIVFVIALVPAAAVFALVFLVGQLALPWMLVVPLAALASALVLALEAVVGIAMLGRAFEKFDLSAEGQT